MEDPLGRLSLRLFFCPFYLPISESLFRPLLRNRRKSAFLLGYFSEARLRDAPPYF